MELVNEKYGSENIHNESAPESSLSEGVVGRGDPLAPYAHLDEKKILRKVGGQSSLEQKADHETDAVFFKMDKRLIPMLALLYLLSFLDRALLSPPPLLSLSVAIPMLTILLKRW